MNSTHKHLIASAAVLLLSACAHAPRAPEPSPALQSIRDKYLAENPDGTFNEQIRRGEIGKGMSMTEVMASWGAPVDRRADENHLAEESWFYVDRDPYSHDFMMYEIAFESRTVQRWYIMRGTVASGGVFDSGAAGYLSYGDRGSGTPVPSMGMGTARK